MFLFNSYKTNQIVPNWIKSEKYWNCEGFSHLIKYFCKPF